MQTDGCDSAGGLAKRQWACNISCLRPFSGMETALSPLLLESRSCSCMTAALTNRLQAGSPHNSFISGASPQPQLYLVWGRRACNNILYYTLARKRPETICFIIQFVKNPCYNFQLPKVASSHVVFCLNNETECVDETGYFSKNKNQGHHPVIKIAADWYFITQLIIGLTHRCGSERDRHERHAERNSAGIFVLIAPHTFKPNMLWLCLEHEAVCPKRQICLKWWKVAAYCSF